MAVTAAALLTLKWMRRAGSAATPSPADAIVVLGAVVWPSRPSREMALRLDLAARLYADGYARHVLCSVGASPNDWMARMVRRELVTRGVPEAALLIDTEGENTRQAVTASLRHAHGRWRHLTVVTTRYHVLRAVREFRRQGLEVSAAAADLPVIGWDRHSLRLRRRRAVQLVREILAIWWYEMGWRSR